MRLFYLNRHYIYMNETYLKSNAFYQLINYEQIIFNDYGKIQEHDQSE